MHSLAQGREHTKHAAACAKVAWLRCGGKEIVQLGPKGLRAKSNASILKVQCMFQTYIFYIMTPQPVPYILLYPLHMNQMCSQTMSRTRLKSTKIGARDDHTLGRTFLFRPDAFSCPSTSSGPARIHRIDGS